MNSPPTREEIETMRPFALERIVTGALPPTTHVTQSWLTPGDRLDRDGCRVCKRQIEDEELLGSRLELPVPIKPELHAACYAAWHVEVEVHARVPVELMLLHSTQDFRESDEYKHIFSAVKNALFTARDLTCQPREHPIDWGDAWGFASPGYIMKLTGLGMRTFGCIIAAWIGHGTGRAALLKLDGLKEMRANSLESLRGTLDTITGRLPPSEP